MPVEVVTHRGKLYLRPVGDAASDSKGHRPAPPEIGHLMPFAVGVILMAGIVVATVAFMAAFSATFEAVSRALPEGSLTAPRSDASRALAIERDRRREALVSYDRHIASSTDQPTLQATWRDLKHREVETLRQLEGHLGFSQPSHRPSGTGDHNP